MAKRFREEISRARELYREDKYDQALQVVESLVKSNCITADQRLECSHLEVKIRIFMGDLENAMRITDEALILARENNKSVTIVDLLLEKVMILWRLGKFDDGLLLAREIDELLSNLKTVKVPVLKERRGSLMRHYGILHWYKGSLDKAEEFHRQSLQVFQELDNDKGEASALNNLGLVQWSKGNLEAAVELYEKSLAINRKMGVPTQIATILTNLGNVYTMKGDLEIALDYQREALKIREAIGNKQDIATALTNTGAVHQKMGNLNQALECYHQALEIYEQEKVKHGIALALNNLGSAYQIRGDLSTALDYHQRSLGIREELGNSQEIAQSLLNIGDIHRIRGEWKLALETFHQSLGLYKESGNETYASILFYMVTVVALEDGQMELADDALRKLQELNARADSRVANQYYRVAQAIRLKSGKSAREKLEAQEILAKVVKEEVVDHALTVTALVHLCELLLFELKMTEDEALFERVNDIAQQILKIAKAQSSFSLLVEAYILQSKLALVQQDIEEAKILLAQAHIMTQEKGLHRLGRKVAHERDLLQTQLDKWHSIIERNPSTKEMIDHTQLDDYLERMIKKTVAVLTKEEKKAFGEEAARRKYSLAYVDKLKDSEKTEKSKFRVGIAQIGISERGDILGESYESLGSGLLGIKKEKVDELRLNLARMIEKAGKAAVKVLLFPEMSIDLNHDELVKEIANLAKKHDMYIIPGSFHNTATRGNLCRVIGPDGVVWEQDKHIPAIIHFEGQKFTEGIDVGKHPRNTLVVNTEYGRMAIIICRDFLDMDLRVELKNHDPPIDLVFNPAFTPVTADFRAAHFDARRSIYAYCFFANIAEFGDSLIYSPERDRTELTLTRGEEGLIYKDVDLFQLRSERKKWETERKSKSFIQSTR